jgi:hypothetical protein
LNIDQLAARLRLTEAALDLALRGGAYYVAGSIEDHAGGIFGIPVVLDEVMHAAKERIQAAQFSEPEPTEQWNR